MQDIHTLAYYLAIKRTTESHKNLDESQKHCCVKKASRKGIQTIQFYLCEVQEQIKLIYGDRNQKRGCLAWVGIDST